MFVYVLINVSFVWTLSTSLIERIEENPGNVRKNIQQ